MSIRELETGNQINEFPYKRMAQEEHELGWFLANTPRGRALGTPPIPREGKMELHDIEVKVLSPDAILEGGLGRRDCGKCNGGSFLYKEQINKHPIVGKIFEWFE